MAVDLTKHDRGRKRRYRVGRVWRVISDVLGGIVQGIAVVIEAILDGWSL